MGFIIPIGQVRVIGIKKLPYLVPDLYEDQYDEWMPDILECKVMEEIWDEAEDGLILILNLHHNAICNW